MVQILNGINESIQHAMRHPFGLDFEVQNKNIYVSFGSLINCIGYNDYLERAVGVTRATFAVFAFLISKERKEKFIAVGHICRAGLEFCGKYEHYLLILDLAFTIVNIVQRILNNKSTKKAETINR